MGQPVVRFEIIGNDPEKLRGYYCDLFGWEFETPSPVAQEVSEPQSYGFLNLVTSEAATGIRGGVGGEMTLRSLTTADFHDSSGHSAQFARSPQGKGIPVCS
jgi:hypothetical protein